MNTVYGIGNRGKSLDVAALNNNGYLLIDISIKTFNFRDRATNNYRHNYTGRFYELLGEELDLRRSYQHAVLVALILLPEDAATELDPSCFAMCVKQFSKVARRTEEVTEQGFDFVFVGVHSPTGDICFFDATQFPPRVGLPRQEYQMSFDEVLERISNRLESRTPAIAHAPLPQYVPFEFE